jgi:hypothetical protein
MRLRIAEAGFQHSLDQSAAFFAYGIQFLAAGNQETRQHCQRNQRCQPECAYAFEIQSGIRVRKAFLEKCSIGEACQSQSAQEGHQPCEPLDTTLFTLDLFNSSFEFVPFISIVKSNDLPQKCRFPLMLVHAPRATEIDDVFCSVLIISGTLSLSLPGARRCDN